MIARSALALSLCALFAATGCVGAEADDGVASEDNLGEDDNAFTAADVKLLWLGDRDNSFDYTDPASGKTFKVHRNWLSSRMLKMVRESDEETFRDKALLSKSAARAVFVYSREHYNMDKFEELQSALDLSHWPQQTIAKLGAVDTNELSEAAAVQSIGKLVAYTRTLGGIDPAPSKLGGEHSVTLTCTEDKWKKGWLGGRDDQQSRQVTATMKLKLEQRGIRYRLANVQVVGDLPYLQQFGATPEVKIDIAGNGRALAEKARISVSMNADGYSIFATTAIQEGDRTTDLNCQGMLPIH